MMKKDFPIFSDLPLHISGYVRRGTYFMHSLVLWFGNTDVRVCA
jgi:hypothetical protein